MRKVKITKQQTINPKAVFMGLSTKQIVVMGSGIALALAVVGLFIFVWGFDVNLTMGVVFVILLVFVGLAVVRINGNNLFKWVYSMMKSPIYRPYESKGALDTYAKEEKEQ